MLEQQSRTCSDSKEAAESRGQTFENLRFCVSEEITVKTCMGLYVNQPHDPRQNNGNGKNKSKESKQQLFFGSPLIWSMVQGYSFLLQKPQQIRGKKRQS